MSDIHQTNSGQPDPNPPRSPDDDETKPNRRVGHPDRTRFSRPEPTPPAAAPSDQPPTPPAPVRDDRLTRPTKPVPVQPRPAFTRQQSGSQRPTQQQEPPPPPTHSRTHYHSPLQQPPTRISQTPPPRVAQPTVVTPPERPPRRWGRWLRRSLTTLLVLSLIGGVLAAALGAITYFWIASQLPPAEELQARAFQSFATSQILDREGNLL